MCLLAHRTDKGSRLYVGGQFSAIGGTPYRSLAAFDGRRWLGVQGLVDSFGNEKIEMMTEMVIGGTPRVIIAGSFEAPQTLDGIGFIDGQGVVRSLPAGPQSPHAWFASAFAWNSPSGPELLLGSGVFPLGSDYLYRYSNGAYGRASPGVLTVTNAYSVFDDGTGPAVFIGVPRVGATFAQTVTKWDGATLTSLTPGLTWVNALCAHDDGNGGGPALYAGGTGIRRYRSGVWETVPGAPGFGIEAMASFDDGTGPALYIAGQFTSAGGLGVANIVRCRGGVWESLNGGLAGGRAHALAVFDEDGPGPRPAALFAAGTFTQAGGINSRGIARWGVEICDSDFNTDGFVSGDDFDAFVSAFEKGEFGADFDRDGFVNGEDFDAYVEAFERGC